MVLMNVPFVDLKIQYLKIKNEIQIELDDVLNNCSFVLGPKVEEFEKKFAKFCNSKYAVGVSSGTSALQIALKSIGVGKGDEVITVPNTFIATTEAITELGATPVFVDIDEKTYNIDVNKIKEKITNKTKAILPVHLFGQPADTKAIMEIAENYDLEVIEDACQAHGAEYNGKKVPFGKTGCFSFYPGKNLGSYGEGGAIVTDDEEIAEKARLIRNHGEKKKYCHVVKGINSRLEAIQAAVLNVKLKHLENWNQLRRKNARMYNKLLNGVVTPYELPNSKHVYHLYVIRTKKRDELQQYLSSKGISTGIHYPTPIHLQEAYKEYNLKPGSYPISEKVSGEILSLPMFPELTEEQITYVTDKIKEFVSKQE